MEQKPANPLTKHFRQPAIYIKLPSSGKYWGNGALDLPVTGEIPVYPMTTRDEITIRTPDALLNGQGVVDVIQSCCPNIRDAWQMPSCDVDTVLLAIRIASYGQHMDFDSNCPSCKEENTYAADLGAVIGTINMPDYTTPLQVDGLTIKLRPQPYFEVNRVSQINFTEQQIMRTIRDAEMPDDEKQTKTNEFLRKLVDLNIDISCNSTESITTEDQQVVTDPAFIKEFYNSADFKIMKTIQARLADIAESANLKPMPATCSHCSHEYEIPMVFDYANFFE